jgi:hypothetical protein
MQLPDSWIAIPEEDAHKFEAELRREVPRGHILYGRTLRAIARRLDQDDVLFQEGGDAAMLVVHLTWSVETDPKWPWVTEYGTLADFLESVAARSTRTFTMMRRSSVCCDLL